MCCNNNQNLETSGAEKMKSRNTTKPRGIYTDTIKRSSIETSKEEYGEEQIVNLNGKNVNTPGYQRIPTGIKILIVEVGITKLLAYHCGAMHGYKTKIIPYVMTWEGIVTTFHKQYRNVLNIDSRTQAYIQARVFKMTLESLSMEARRGKKFGIIKCESRPISTCDNI
ncbi:hypothetical protein NAPIS_ORF00974 [Vairimorpha apis BRL 01]|uniref:Uncharacterized protein n=1 Tax=Vairimorpha apis BRL 01 TaxID=1037528 RepID=T0LB01_9MICR|nr:hypothetical protein NAPIS_ORF00974 [Vairimorpha apis BRL 01]